MSEDQESVETQSEDVAVEETTGAPAKPRLTGGTNDSINASLEEIDDVETLKSMVRTLRSENGNHRRKNKTVEEENLALKSWKLDHLKGVADAEDKVMKADQIAKRAVIKAAVLEFDIDEDLVDLISGETEEEIYEKASKLANTRKKGGDAARNPLEPGWVPGPTNLLPGKRGEPVRKNRQPAEDDGSWLRDAWFK